MRMRKTELRRGANSLHQPLEALAIAVLLQNRAHEELDRPADAQGGERQSLESLRRANKLTRSLAQSPPPRANRCRRSARVR